MSWIRHWMRTLQCMWDGLVGGYRAGRARQKAMNAWASWDEHDVEVEIAAIKELP